MYMWGFRGTALLCLLLLWLGQTEVVQGKTVNCNTATKCSPWGSPPCRRHSPINLRFMLDIAKENYVTVEGVVQNYTTYGFCPLVDYLQSFSLNGAGALTSAKLVDKKYTLVPNMTKKYLRVFGFGNLDSIFIPSEANSSSAVLVAVNDTTLCGDTTLSVAVVDTLILEIGMYRGAFNYFEETTDNVITMLNPDYNAAKCAASKTTTQAPSETPSETPPAAELDPTVDYCSQYIDIIETTTVNRPAKTGFVPTCKYDEKEGMEKCLFKGDGEGVCIGDYTGKRNCGRCIYADNAEDLVNIPIQIWTSYFGTDIKKETLLSGGDNPMNYQQFAGSDMLSTIAEKIEGVWNETNTGNTSTKPEWWPW